MMFDYRQPAVEAKAKKMDRRTADLASSKTKTVTSERGTGMRMQVVLRGPWIIGIRFIRKY